MRMFVKNSKICVAVFAAICIGLLCGIAPPRGAFSARAEQVQNPRAVTTKQVETTVVKHKTDCTYRYFDYPSAICASDGGFTVADGTYAYRFGNTGIPSAEDPVSIPQNTSKAAVHNGKFIVLSDGQLRAQSGDGYVSLGSFVDFAIYRDSLLFAIDGEAQGNVYVMDISGEITEDLQYEIAARVPDKKLKKIAADSQGALYLTTPNQYDVYCDDVICFAVTQDNSLTERTARLYGSEEILDMQGTADGGMIALTRGGIYRYRNANETLALSHAYACTDAVAVAESNGVVYGISRLKSIFKLNPDMSERTELLASAHDEQGFFNANAGIAALGQKIAVADERNNRVQIISADNTRTLDGALTRPTATAIDYTGNIYVAELNGIAVYNDEGKYSHEIATPYSPIVIADMNVDSLGGLRILTEGGQVFGKTGDGAFAAFNDPDDTAKITAIAVAESDDALYATTEDNRIVMLKDGKKTDVITDTPKAVDFCTDHDDSFYLLTEGGEIVKYTKGDDGKYNETHRVDGGFKHASRIAMNTADFEGDIVLSYGDILVSDTGAHALKKISRDELDVNKKFNSSSDLPDPDETEKPDDADSVASRRIIYRVKYCKVYESEAVKKELYTLDEGISVIVPSFDPDKKFTYIIADNLTGGNTADAIRGYVLTTCIYATATEYVKSPSSSCYSFIEEISVYKYPTRNSADVYKIADVKRNVKLNLLDFVSHDKDGKQAFGYRDNFSHSIVWYRVSYTDPDDGKTYEGYVMSAYASMRGENPDDRNVYPRYNATIISKEKGKDFPAVLYGKNDDGEIVPLAVIDPDFALQTLNVGERVEVVGSFDSSEKYTHIKYYYDGVGGTMDFYVETANIEYEGVNKVLIVAVVLIVITVILAAVLIIRYLYVKKIHKGGDKL